MCLVTLIATGHRERGLCNSNELFKIIEGIAPEVIFEEIPASKFSFVYEGKTTDSLETSTIKRYLQTYPISHFPVDMDMNDLTSTHLRREVEKVFDIVAYYNPEYASLLNEHGGDAERLGFPYLNSDQCSTLLARASDLEEQVIKNINDSILSKTYYDWLNFLDSRRKEMLSNIYKYSDANKYQRALFLVGAEHRKPLIDKISKYENTSNQNVMWVFNYL